VSTQYALIEGRKLDRLHPGNTLDRFFLADVRHPGTLGQALMARMFIETVNAKFAAGIAPLEPREVLTLARSVVPPVDPAVALASLGGTANPRLSPARTVMPARAIVQEKALGSPDPVSR
jgi:phospholipase/lecithinase/hemolysin